FISAPNTKGDVKYSIKADPITRRIEYVLNSGQNNPDNPNVWNVGQVINLKAATRSGYLFGGWFKDTSFDDSSKVKTINEGITEDLKLYAKWIKAAPPTNPTYTKTKKSVTITFTKADSADYTIFICKGKTYKAKENTVTIKGLGKNRRYVIKAQSVWKLDDGKPVKSRATTFSVRTAK
ncbi:MAG: InlB B-repeat-containing protein, partial [Eubacterium sp.]|nr:InlB B-repeat-containing protein [Eubacterium sp.]